MYLFRRASWSDIQKESGAKITMPTNTCATVQCQWKVTYRNYIPVKAGDSVLMGLDLFGNPVVMKIELSCATERG